MIRLLDLLDDSFGESIPRIVQINDVRGYLHISQYTVGTCGDVFDKRTGRLCQGSVISMDVYRLMESVETTIKEIEETL